MKFKTYLATLILFAGLFSACKKGGDTPEPPPAADTTKPSISMIDPFNNKSVTLGTPLTIEIDFADNKALGSYKIEIKKSLKGVETADWVYSNVWSIAPGLKSFKAKHSEIAIPLTVTAKPTTTGLYDMTVTCTDAAGNTLSTTITLTVNK